MAKPNYLNGVASLRADFRCVIYDLDNGGARLVIEGTRTGRRFTSDTASRITIILWFVLLRLYLDAANSLSLNPLPSDLKETPPHG